MKLSSIVGGELVHGDGAEVLDLAPASPDTVLASYREADAGLVDRAADLARRAAPRWRDTPFHERAAVLARAGRLLEARVDDLGRTLSQEEGKPLTEGTAEVARAARILGYYAAEADREVGALYASPRRGEQVLTKQVPVGPTAIITPWNFPIAIPTWKLAPALVYGNPVVWKPSPVTPILATRLAEVLFEAGLPDDVLHLVLGGAEAGRRLLEHPAIRACSFTGSTPVGRAVLAAGAGHGTAVQAEMGGVNAAIVLADADLDVAAAAIVEGAMGSTGQKCTATSRVLVDRAVHDDLLDRIVTACDALVTGDPLEAGTDLGPVATRPQLAAISEALEDVREAGGGVVRDGTEGLEPDGGFFVRPSVVVGVAEDHPVCTDEVFGPFVAVTAVADVEDAFERVNAGAYGLTASIFTSDLATAMSAVDRLEVGIVHVNSATTGAEPHVPFGGTKGSGAGGREQGRAAREFYTETRTAYLA